MVAVALCFLLLAGAFGGEATNSSPSQHLMFVSHLGRSHMIPYLEILAPLAQRGHNISVITDTTAAAWIRDKYPLFNIILVPEAIEERMRQFRAGKDSVMAKMMDFKLASKFQSTGFAMILEHITLPTYQILADHFRVVFTTTKPDMVLCDWMVEPCADMADTLQIKYATTLSGIPPGVSDSPYTNSWFSPHPHSTTEHLNLWQRFQGSFVLSAKVAAAMRKPLKKLAEVKKRCGINAADGPPVVRHKHALKIINTFLGFESPRPVDPLVQLIGPIRSHVNSTLPAAVQEWLGQLSSPSGSSNATPRVIYVAFGTHVDMPTEVVMHLSTALMATLDAGHADGVIWAVSNIKRDKFPAAIEQHRRILLLPFAPQMALLAHPAVSLFVSHGGAESCHEAMYEAKPMLVIPFFGDQPMNAVKLREAGMAEFIRFTFVTADNVKALLYQMLHPRTAAPYQVAANRMRSLVRTLVTTNTILAANMLEFFSQYGWEHLISAGSKMPWYKANNMDLYAAVGLAALVAVSTPVVLIWYVLKRWQRQVTGSGSTRPQVMTKGAIAAQRDTVLRDQNACNAHGEASPGRLEQKR